MKIKIEQNKQLLDKVDALHFDLEVLFYDLSETKKFELTPQVTKKLYEILTKYKEFKTELIETYKVEIIPRSVKVKYDPLSPMFSLITEALTLSQSIHHGMLSNNLDMETISSLDNIMDRIERTILFYHYFNFIL